MKKLILAAFLLIVSMPTWAQKKYEVQTVAFYNLENLFDTLRNEDIYDESFTPTGSYGWTSERYNNKIANMSRVLSEIGTNSSMKTPPAVIGVCEIENREVLEDLVNSPKLAPYNYDIVHYHSPDERGIDAGFLYRKDLFKVDTSMVFKTVLPDPEDKTRDILLVSGQLRGEKMHFLVNHWPSRSGGEAISMPNRFAAAKNLKSIINSIQEVDENAKIIAMGDFNDDPVSPSIAEELGAIGKQHKLKNRTDIFNPYYEFYKKGAGTTAWRDAWSLFDMLMVTKSTIENKNNGFQYFKAGRFTPDYITQEKGRFKGYPKRTHSFGNYLNGYSDHFPVYIYLAREVE